MTPAERTTTSRALTSVASHGVTDKSNRSGAVRTWKCWEMETQQCSAGCRAFPQLFSAFPQMPHRWHPMQCHSPQITSWAVGTQLFVPLLKSKCFSFYTKPNSFPPKKFISIKTFNFTQNEDFSAVFEVFRPLQKISLEANMQQSSSWEGKEFCIFFSLSFWSARKGLDQNPKPQHFVPSQPPETTAKPRLVLGQQGTEKATTPELVETAGCALGWRF